ncbi:Flagellar export FliJ [Rhodopirellula maiorica SM1]|uniref:Flagellar FliJ protein n=1 Tax=Rhodopirellula maiorica SM1 TaxID=1265738 RepID=M5S6A8_9BACT|nr:flagellar export protein FliJ [Rhodopirellula maiorica]EMI21724.1 Flagellar export FliJ [Rhodopirellula maiorica SM1]
MKYEFRFESILDLRQRERDEMGGLVGEANLAIAKIEQQIQEIEQERQTLRNEDAQSRLGDVAVDRLLTRGRFDLQLQAEINGLVQTRTKLEEELERRQQRLRDAETEVKKFQRMKEIDRNQFRQEMNRREQIEIDEMNNRRFAIASQKLRDTHLS